MRLASFSGWQRDLLLIVTGLGSFAILLPARATVLRLFLVNETPRLCVHRRSDRVGFHLLLSPHFAWYWSWSVLFLAFVPRRPMRLMFLFIAAALVHYATWFDDWRIGLHPHPGVDLLQIAPAVLLLGATFIRRRSRRGKRFSPVEHETRKGWSSHTPSLGLNTDAGYARNQ